MKAMKKLQPYADSDPMFKAFADNSIGHNTIKSVLQRGESILKQQNHFKETTLAQDEEYINKLIDPKGSKKDIDPIDAIEAVSIIADKYSAKKKKM